MFRLSRWLYQQKVFALVQHVAPLFCNGHWYNYFLQPGQAVGPVFSLSYFPIYISKVFFSRKSFKTKAVRLFLGSIFKYLHVMLAG